MTLSPTDILILETLTTTGASAREVWIKMGMWAENSVRTRLVALTKRGLIVRDKKPIPSGYQWMYRKP